MIRYYFSALINANDICVKAIYAYASINQINVTRSIIHLVHFIMKALISEIIIKVDIIKRYKKPVLSHHILFF